MTIEELTSLASLTASIEKLPALPTKIGSSGLFSPRPIRTTQVIIDEKQGKLSLVPNTSRRAPGVHVAGRTGKTRTFMTTHLSERGEVIAEDVQGLRGFGSEDQFESVAAKFAETLQDLKNNLVVTREWQKMGAIKGQILDADGSTVIEDLYDAFGVTQTVKALNLSSATDPRDALMEAARLMDEACGAMMIASRRCYCSGSFLDAFVKHDKVKAAYAGYQLAADRLGGDLRNGFVHGGIEFIEYTASVSGHKFIDDGDAYLFPVASGLFVEALAPAPYLETVNTLGKEFYAKSKVLDFDMGYDIEAQCNPFPLCLIPASVIKLEA